METGTMMMLVLVASIAILIFLILRVKIHPFLSLIIVCIFVGVATGMPLPKIATSIENGMAGTLGSLAIIIGFGTILGKMLEVSGGAERLARTLLEKMGEKRAPWAMTIVGLIAGIPVFFEVGFVLLFPLVFIVAKQAKMSLLRVGIPLAVSLMVVHSMVPPHPAAFAITTTLGADVGKVILYALLIGTPTAILAGPIWAKFISTKCKTGVLKESEGIATPVENLPSFGITLFTILLPLFIMVGKTVSTLFLSKDSSLLPIVTFLGNPLIALLISVFVAYYTLGLSRGLKMKNLLTLTEQCFGPIAGILLIIGGGGAFNGILVDSGVGNELSKILMSLNMNPIILAWLIAWLMHLAIGSATVAMISTAGMVAPMLAAYPGMSPEIIVLAIGSGAIGWCHVNDSSFWFVKEYLGLSLPDMFKSFTAACLIASFVSLGGILLLSLVI
ncbi:D-serine transporter DsdX [Paenibacillus baekrokdamisoli]|uniref:D-serine transporter DsdX n=1 Tax=Paenibacillus baekrokdamisoli TaxID=1712516 RepID=A0A3G9IZH5_9BACL|nr:gluconate:H+ symporter [Paenibacillus baekrokdamisoli]MBB3073192.1 GntP family gluconate:H+ symporter/D-serine transporter [Paenibacillus baekrokdamisoli]BBH24300.1 D-serine transporter DsdX [Paenibacillus baekrokdamisoli]